MDRARPSFLRAFPMASRGPVRGAPIERRCRMSHEPNHDPGARAGGCLAGLPRLLPAGRDRHGGHRPGRAGAPLSAGAAGRVTGRAAASGGRPIVARSSPSAGGVTRPTTRRTSADRPRPAALAAREPGHAGYPVAHGAPATERRTRHELLALAGTLTSLLHGSGVTIAVRFGEVEPERARTASGDSCARARSPSDGHRREDRPSPFGRGGRERGPVSVGGQDLPRADSSGVSCAGPMFEYARDGRTSPR
jgi:hypothetical protein